MARPPIPIELEQYISVGEAARILRLSEAGVYALGYRGGPGGLERYSVGRDLFFSKAEVYDRARQRGVPVANNR